MSRRYDTRTTIFSPEGRLYQVEYAMEAIGNAAACVGILAQNGVVIGAERRHLHKLLDHLPTSEKIYKLSDHAVCGVSGITADATVLINHLRVIAQRYQLQYNEPMPIEQMVRSLADVKQVYTQVGGKRPFGVSFLYAGWDDRFGYQLYQSDPSGNYSGWRASVIGQNAAAGMNWLKGEYNAEEVDVELACEMAIKALSKCMDEAKFDGERIELAVISRSDEGRTEMKLLPGLDVEKLVKAHKVTVQKEKDAAAAAASKKPSSGGK